MSSSAEDTAALGAVKVALRLVSVSLPHLSELIAAVRVVIDPRVGTAGIFRSGRMLLNPAWFTALPPTEAAFVIAHELMHLALRTHDREAGIDPEVANWAHDYIINDMLSESLGCPVPAGGLELPGARSMSMEELARKIQAMRSKGRLLRAWSGAPMPLPLGGLGAALRKSGVVPDNDRRS